MDARQLRRAELTAAMLRKVATYKRELGAAVVLGKEHVAEYERGADRAEAIIAKMRADFEAEQARG